tara:strand:- start:629 stop:1261 length:633 start_codon:yes stop_codon:yes gene_type:complete
MLGSALVGTAEADITYVKSKTDITYVNATTDILLDYDSKNKEFHGEDGETVTLSEAFTKTVVYSRTFTDSITVVDDPSIGQIHKPYPTDSASVADELALQFNLSLTDSLSSSDAFVWTIGKNFTESVNAGDTPSIGQIHHENPTDGVTASDTPGIGAIHHVNPTDSIAASDAVSYMHDGMLNTNMLNTRLISVGSLAVEGDDVQVTHIVG